MNSCCIGCKIYNFCIYADLPKLECTYLTIDYNNKIGVLRNENKT